MLRAAQRSVSSTETNQEQPQNNRKWMPQNKAVWTVIPITAFPLSFHTYDPSTNLTISGNSSSAWVKFNM
mgnify:CR=1 FL=1|jgi:hypothetical protein